MGFSLKNMFEEAWADINPFDHGQTGASIRAARQRPAPAQTPPASASRPMTVSTSMRPSSLNMPTLDQPQSRVHQVTMPEAMTLNPQSSLKMPELQTANSPQTQQPQQPRLTPPSPVPPSANPDQADIYQQLNNRDKLDSNGRIQLYGRAMRSGVLSRADALNAINAEVDHNTPKLPDLNPVQQFVGDTISFGQKVANTGEAAINGVTGAAQGIADAVTHNPDARLHQQILDRQMRENLSRKTVTGDQGSFITYDQARNDNGDMYGNFIKPIVSTAAEATPYVIPYGSIVKAAEPVGAAVMEQTGSKLLSYAAKYGAEAGMNAPIFAAQNAIQQGVNGGQFDPWEATKAGVMGGVMAGGGHAGADIVGAGVRSGAAGVQSAVQRAQNAHNSRLLDFATADRPTWNVRPDNIQPSNVNPTPEAVQTATKEILNGRGKPVYVRTDESGFSHIVGNHDYHQAYNNLQSDWIPTKNVNGLQSMSQGGWIGKGEPGYVEPHEANYINEQVASHSSPKEFTDSIVNRIWDANKQGKGVDTSLIPDEYGSGYQKRVSISNNSRFYQDFYREYGRKPTKAAIKDMVEQTLTGKPGEYRNLLTEGDITSHDADVYSQLLDRQEGAVRQTQAPKVKANPTQFDEFIAEKRAREGFTTKTSANNQDISKFPTRLMDDSRTEPINDTLLRNSAHEVKKNANVLNDAENYIKQDEAAADRFAKTGDTTEANATAMQLLDKYLNEGRMDDATSLIEAISPRFTRQGQQMQILGAFSKTTPAGAVRYASKIVEHGASNAGKHTRLENEAHQLSDSLTNVNKEAAKTIADELQSGKLTGEGASNMTPEERLAKRIKASAQAKGQQPDPITDMVNTLHAVAKESLPAAGKKAPRNPMELVGTALNDHATYRDVWQKAKDIVAEKYAGNEAALEELDSYFNKQLDTPFSQKQLNRGVQNGLKGVDLGKIVRQHYSVVDEAGRSLEQRLTEEAGVDPARASQLAQAIKNRFAELTNAKKQQIMDQMFKGKPTPEQKTMATKIMEMSNLGAFSKDELRPLIAKKLKMDTLTPEAAQEITKQAQAIQEMPEGSKERMRATAEMMQFIANQAHQPGLDKMISVWKAGLLSGAKTQGGNFESNASFLGLKAISDVPAAIFDQAMSLATGKRAKTATQRGTFSGAREGMGKGKDTLLTGLDERNINGGKYEEHGELRFKNKAVQAIIGTPSNLVFRGMNAADQPFYYSALRKNLYDLAKVDGINNGLRGSDLRAHMSKTVKDPPIEMAQQAADAAWKSVLGYDTIASKAVSAIHSGIDKIPAIPGREKSMQLGKNIAHAAVNTAAPFVRIPTAFIARTLDFTPVGAIKEAGAQAYNGKFDQRKLAEALGEATTGTAVIYLGAQLANGNLLSGNYPSNDPHEIERWKTEGIQPNSIKIYNPLKGKEEWISLNYLGPVGLLFGAGKDYHDAAARGDSGTMAAIAGAGKNLTQQSFLTGFSGFSNALNDPQRNAKSFINSQAGSVVPAWVNDLANVGDTKQRETNSPLDSMKSRVPGLRNTLPVKEDVYGNELDQRTDPVDQWVNPLRPSSQKHSLVIDEVSRLHSVDQNNKNLEVTPTRLQKNISFGGTDANGQEVKTQLTDAQLHDLQHRVGQATQDGWTKLIQTNEYKSLSDEDKAKALSNMASDIASAEKARYANENSLGQYDPNFDGKTNKISKSAQALLNGQDTTTKYAKNVNSIGSTTDIHPSLKKSYADTLTQYDAMTEEERTKQFNDQPDAEYKYELAKANNDMLNGKLSRAEQARTENSLAKAKVGSSFDKETRDLYGLSKSELWGIVSTDPNGQKMADSILAYGDALEAAGLGKNKFRNSKGSVALQPTSGSSGSSKSSKGKSSHGISYKMDGYLNVGSTAKSLRDILKEAKISSSSKRPK